MRSSLTVISSIATFTLSLLLVLQSCTSLQSASRRHLPRSEQHTIQTPTSAIHTNTFHIIHNLGNGNVRRHYGNRRSTSSSSSSIQLTLWNDMNTCPITHSSTMRKSIQLHSFPTLLSSITSNSISITTNMKLYQSLSSSSSLEMKSTPNNPSSQKENNIKTNNINNNNDSNTNNTPKENNNNNNEDDEDDNDDDENNNKSIINVSDEEVILACRAYLQKKNRLGGWIDHNKRKEQSLKSLALARVPSSVSTTTTTTSSSSRSNSSNDNSRKQLKRRSRKGGGTTTTTTKKRKRVRKKNKLQQQRKKDTTRADKYMNTGVGYFWEDPNELRYLRKGRLLDDEYHVLSTEIEDEKKKDMQSANDYDLQQQWMDEMNDEEEEELYQQSLSSATKDDQERGGIFTTFPVNPSADFLKRSKIRKAFFNDPEWKARWYEKRWGGTTITSISETNDESHDGNENSSGGGSSGSGGGATTTTITTTNANNRKMRTIEEKRQQRREVLLQKIPSKILNSPEFVSLSDDEIEQAIKTYITANARRSTSLKIGRQTRAGDRQIKPTRNNIGTFSLERDIGEKSLDDGENDESSTNNITNELFFFSSTEALKDAQRKRSERAAKAYQTRLKNQAKMDNNKASMKVSTNDNEEQTQLPLYSTESDISKICPKVALGHIESTLKVNKVPSVKDIVIVMEPKRLGRRKDVFRTILSQCFQLRGKCIPDISFPDVESDSPSAFDPKEYEALIETAKDKKFLTKSTVKDIGWFILYLLHSKDTGTSLS